MSGEDTLRDILLDRGFKHVLIDIDPEGQDIVSGYYYSILLTFQVGSENIYLKNTPFWSKYDWVEFVDRVAKLLEAE